jgi:NAD(P)-dependent dehydrogenase (short-subunit alcohol dehydrogenase family)
MGLKKINFDDLQWEKSYGPWKAYCQSKLADLMLMLELERRRDAAHIRLLSNAAHPRYARTNLQTSGPGREQNPIEKIMASFMSHDAAAGALPTLRAATTEDAASGSYYGPEKMFHLKGDPVTIPLPEPAQNIEAAGKLWEISERLTGAAWPGVNSGRVSQGLTT